VPHYPAELGSTPEDQLYLALAQVKQASNLKAGIAQLSAAIAKHAPTRADWYLELAGALDQDREFDRALAMYREAAKRSPALLCAGRGS